MKKVIYNPVQMFRPLAHELAISANQFNRKAKKENLSYKYWDKAYNLWLKELKNYYLKFYAIIYFLFLILDAIYVAPVLKNLMEEHLNFGPWGTFMAILFYSILIFGSTLLASSYRAQRLLHNLDVQLNQMKSMNTAFSIHDSQLTYERFFTKNWSRVGFIVLILAFLGINLYRIYVQNEFNAFDLSAINSSNITYLCFGIGIFCCLYFFSVCKLPLNRLRVFKSNRRKHLNLCDQYSKEDQRLSLEAIDQNDIANKVREQSTVTKELKEVLNRYEYETADTRFVTRMSIFFRLLFRGIPVPNITCTAITSDYISISSESDKDGIVTFSWAVTDSDIIRAVEVGPIPLSPGSIWNDPSKINTVDLELLLLENDKDKLKYFESRINKTPIPSAT